VRRGSSKARGRGLDDAGFTVLELGIVVVVGSLLLGVGMHGITQYRERTALVRAGIALQDDVTLTRALAIRDRRNVSLVVDETQREYVVRAEDGTVLHERRLSSGNDMALSSLDLTTSGDSLTFDSRGLMVTTGTVQIDFARAPHARRLVLNAFGRGRVVVP